MQITRSGAQPPSARGPANCFTGNVRIDAPFQGGVWVTFEPGETHWHGATAQTTMTHIAIAEALDGKVVDWPEHVSGVEYGAR